MCLSFLEVQERNESLPSKWYKLWSTYILNSRLSFFVVAKHTAKTFFWTFSNIYNSRNFVRKSVA